VNYLLIEVSWLGRGGQGAVTASRILAKAAVKEKLWAQSIVFFGAERRGAPVYAYNRISDKYIKYHHFVHNPDVAIVFDESLLKITNILDQLKEGGTLILNTRSKEIPKEIKDKRLRVAVVNATDIALELKLTVAGIPVVNTAMIGAFAKVMNLPSIDSVVEAIRDTWSGSVGELNAEASRRAYTQTKIVKEL